VRYPTPTGAAVPLPADLVNAARSPAETRRPAVTRGAADPDAGFRDPAGPPHAAIGIIALDIAHCTGIGARRPSRMRSHRACAQSDGYQQGAQRCLWHDYRPAFLAERETDWIGEKT
jgi:hypothetical protein